MRFQPQSCAICRKASPVGVEQRQCQPNYPCCHTGQTVWIGRSRHSGKLASNLMCTIQHDQNLFRKIKCISTEASIRASFTRYHFQVPWWKPHLRKYMEEMTPIFKNVEVSRDDIGETMRQFALKNDLMPQPRRSLIGSYIGSKVLLTSPLLKW